MPSSLVQSGSCSINWRTIGLSFSPSDLNNDKSPARTQFNSDFANFVATVLGRPASSVGDDDE